MSSLNLLILNSRLWVASAKSLRFSDLQNIYLGEFTLE